MLVGRMTYLCALEGIFGFSCDRCVAGTVVPYLLIALLSPVLPLYLRLVSFRLPFIGFLMMSDLSMLSIIVTSCILTLGGARQGCMGSFFRGLGGGELGG